MANEATFEDGKELSDEISERISGGALAGESHDVFVVVSPDGSNQSFNTREEAAQYAQYRSGARIKVEHAYS